jgi:hypothetical protein
MKSRIALLALACIPLLLSACVVAPAQPGYGYGYGYGYVGPPVVVAPPPVVVGGYWYRGHRHW